MKKKIDQCITIFICLALVLNIGYFAYRISRKKSEIKSDGLIYYMHTDNSINYALQKNNNKIVKYYEYYIETKIKNAKENIHFIIDMDDANYVTKVIEKDRETKKNIAVYLYYPKTKYSRNHFDNVRYIFHLDENGYIQYAEEYEQQTGKLVKYYEYYENIIFDDRGNNIQMVYYLNNELEIEYSIKREKKTGKELEKVYYENKTKYDKEHFSHKNKVINREEITNSIGN